MPQNIGLEATRTHSPVLFLGEHWHLEESQPPSPLPPWAGHCFHQTHWAPAQGKTATHQDGQNHRPSNDPPDGSIGIDVPTPMGRREGGTRSTVRRGKLDYPANAIPQATSDIKDSGLWPEPCSCVPSPVRTCPSPVAQEHGWGTRSSHLSPWNLLEPKRPGTPGSQS